MRVSEGHAGGGSRQATGAAAAGTQGGGLVLASAPDPVRHIALPAVPPQRLPGLRIARESPGTPAPALGLTASGLRAPPCGRAWNCTASGTPAQLRGGRDPSPASFLRPGLSRDSGATCPLTLPPTQPDRSTHGATGERRAALALAAHRAGHAGAGGANVLGPALPGGHCPALVRARLGGR